MKSTIGKILLALPLIVASTLAGANTLSLDDVTIVKAYQQTTNSPCVIGESSCQNPAGFGLTEFPTAGSPNSYDEFSPVYTVAQIRAIVGNSFWVGVDVNQSNVVQELSLFTMLINGVVVDTWTGPQLVPPTVGGGNGNGYADYLLTGFTSLVGYADSTTVQFHAILPLVDDGREQFFLIAAGTPPQVPEPATLALLGLGLAGLGFARRRKV